MMNFKTYETPMEYYPIVKDFLYRNEIMNVLTIGLLRNAKVDDNYSKCFYCTGSVSDEIKIALIVHGLHIILVTEDDHYLKLGAEYLSSVNIDFPGVIGPRPFVDQFVEHLVCASKKDITLRMSQRIYKLDEVNDIQYSNGYMRLATHDDLEIVLEWNEDFVVSEGISANYERMKKKRQQDIDDETLFLWIDNETPVTMTNLSNRTSDGAHIGLVYTPEDQRRKGYATSLVAKVSRHALQKYTYCTLYTDLGNPVSNSIYMKIGYNPIVDSAMYLVNK
jgi:hypothetical protein